MRRGAIESCDPRQPRIPCVIPPASIPPSSGCSRPTARPSTRCTAAHGALAQCRVEAWRSATLETYPWLKGRLEHLRLSEIRDSAAPRREQLVESQRLAELQIGSVLHDFLPRRRPAGRHPGSRERAAARRLGREPAAAAEAARQLAGHRPRAPAHRRRACTSSKSAWSSRRAPPTTACGTSTSRATKSISRRAGSRCWATRRMRMLDSPDWRSLVHPEDMSRVQIGDPRSRRRQEPDIRKRASHEAPQRRLALGGEPRQGARGRTRAPAAPGRCRARHHRTQALRRSAVPREGKRADHAAVHR